MNINNKHASPAVALDGLVMIKKIVCCPEFCGMMFGRNIRRILLALIVFGYSRQEKDCGNSNNGFEYPENVQMPAREELKSLILEDSSYKRIVAAELRSTITGPMWMRAIGTHLLASLLLSASGLEATLWGYLEGGWVIHLIYSIV